MIVDMDTVDLMVRGAEMSANATGVIVKIGSRKKLDQSAHLNKK